MGGESTRSVKSEGLCCIQTVDNSEPRGSCSETLDEWSKNDHSSSLILLVLLEFMEAQNMPLISPHPLFQDHFRADMAVHAGPPALCPHVCTRVHSAEQVCSIQTAPLPTSRSSSGKRRQTPQTSQSHFVRVVVRSRAAAQMQGSNNDKTGMAQHQH